MIDRYFCARVICTKKKKVSKREKVQSLVIWSIFLEESTIYRKVIFKILFWSLHLIIDRFFAGYLKEDSRTLGRRLVAKRPVASF